MVMHGGVHRADDLAWRILAMHARHRFETSPRIVRRAGVIPVDAQPMHDAVVEHLILADDRNVVFRLTGDGAGLAADTGIEIDRHRPGIARILVRRVQRLVVFFLLREIAGSFESRRATLHGSGHGR